MLMGMAVMRRPSITGMDAALGMLFREMVSMVGGGVIGRAVAADMALGRAVAADMALGRVVAADMALGRVVAADMALGNSVAANVIAGAGESAITSSMMAAG